MPGEAELAGRGVSYCALCDGPFFRDQVIAVVGGGNTAVEAADYLTRFGQKVYLIHRRDALRAQPIIRERALANPKLEVCWNTVVEAIKGRDQAVWTAQRVTAAPAAPTVRRVQVVGPCTHDNSQGGFVRTSKYANPIGDGCSHDLIRSWTEKLGISRQQQ